MYIEKGRELLRRLDDFKKPVLKGLEYAGEFKPKANRPLKAALAGTVIVAALVIGSSIGIGPVSADPPNPDGDVNININCPPLPEPTPRIIIVPVTPTPDPKMITLTRDAFDASLHHAFEEGKAEGATQAAKSATPTKPLEIQLLPPKEPISQGPNWGEIALWAAIGGGFTAFGLGAAHKCNTGTWWD